MSDPLESISSSSPTFEDLSTEALTSPLCRVDTLDTVVLLLIPDHGPRKPKRSDNGASRRGTSSFDPESNAEYQRFLEQEDTGVMKMKMSNLQFDMFVQEDVARRAQRHDVKILTIRPPKLPMTPNFDHVVYSESENEVDDEVGQEHQEDEEEEEEAEESSRMKQDGIGAVSHDHERDLKTDSPPQLGTSDDGSEGSSSSSEIAVDNIANLGSDSLMSLDLSEMIDEESRRVLEKYKVKVKEAVFQDFDQEVRLSCFLHPFPFHSSSLVALRSCPR